MSCFKRMAFKRIEIWKFTCQKLGKQGWGEYEVPDREDITERVLEDESIE